MWESANPKVLRVIAMWARSQADREALFCRGFGGVEEFEYVCGLLEDQARVTAEHQAHEVVAA